MKSALTKVLAIVVLLALVVTPVLAVNTPQADGPRGGLERSDLVPEDTSFTKQHFTAVEPESVISLERSERYVILFEEPSLVAVSKDAAQLDTTSPQSLSYLEKLAKQRNSVMASVESTLGRSVSIKHVYDVILNGVSVEMSPEEAQQLAKVSGIRQILPVTLEQPDTDAGPTWIGAGGVWDGSADPEDLGSLGEGMLVGIIDTGINFDHPSFSASPSDGYTYSWTGDYLGVCATDGDPAYASACNDKLVGAYTYTDETVSPEDSDGHGSHTASTVAGNYVTFEFMGVETTISGVVPHAQIISFDVCDASGCWGDDSAAAVEQAIIDGVDVLNYSISGGQSPYSDVVELAFLEAFGEDIFVAASGGNQRDEPTTDGYVNHLSPWVTTVAASSHNRKFTNDIDVVQPVDSPWVDMAVIQSSSPVPFPPLDNVELKWAGDDTASTSDNYPDNREGCSAFPAGFFNEKVALIQRGICTFADKVNNAQAAGAIGMLAYADSRPPLSMGGLDTATLPAAMLYLSSADSAAFASYVDTNTPVLIDMSLLGRFLNDTWGDIKADFSFRGPSANNLQVLKPDITAPGLEVLAAVADGVIDSDGAVQAALYQGTSMSSPHTAGAGALLSAVFPDWTVAQVKSALMLTAERDNLIKEDMQTPADLFDFGAGRVDLEMASLTGLTMDETYENMVAANPGEGGDMKTLNIASLYNSLCVGECSWTRTFTSVADVSAEYTVTAPAWVTVEPAIFTIAAGETQTITVTADVSGLTEDEWSFATILFETTATHSGGKAISEAAIPVAVLPVGSNIPEFVSFETHRDADMGTIPDLLAGEITAGNTYESGLVKADLEEIVLDPDPTNGDPFDDLSQVYVKTVDVPAYSIRLVAEVTQTTSSDVDMFLFWDADASGTLDPAADYLLAQSATATALEYINAPKDFIFYDADDVYFLVVQNWAGTAGDTITLATGIVPLVPEVGNYDVIVPATNPAATPFQIDVYWNEDTEEGDRLYGYFDTCADAACEEGAGWIGATDIDIRRLADDVVKTAMPGDTITYTIEITNFADVATDYSINDVLPAGVTYVPDSVTGGAVYDAGTNAITWSGTVDAPQAPYYNVTDSLTDSLCDTGFDGYADLETFGILPQSSISGDTKAWGVGAGSIPFNFYGVDYNAMYFTDDGFAIFDPVNTWVPAPMPWVNQDIPDTELPNALAAILWQDMEVIYDPNPTLLRGVSIATAGANYHVIEYDDVQPYGDSSITYDFEIVYQHSVVDTPGWYEIVFAYDNINGPLNLATIGLENYAGTAAAQYAYMDANFVNGHMVCFDLVTPSTTHVITFQVTVDTIPDQGLLINEALHENNAPGTLEEAAVAVVQLPWVEPKINEFSFNTAGTDVEFVEIIGSPNADYSAYTFVEIESDPDAGPGLIDGPVYAMGTTDANGLYLASLPANALENSSVTFLLVKDFTGASGQDLDTDNDGVLDLTPWAAIADSIAVSDGDGYAYAGAPQLYQNYDGLPYAPGGASRIPDGFDTDTITDWVRNDFDLAGIPGFDGSPVDGEAYNTPGEFNQIVNVIAYADTYTTVEETELVVAVAGGVLVNDTDLDGDPLTAELVTDVSYGTLALASDGSFTYTPDLNFFGEDTFTYKATDGTNKSATTLVTIDVTPVNDAPEAVDDEYSVLEDGLLEVAAPGVLANDIEVDLDNMVVSLVTNVEHGSLVLLGDGSFTYQPEPDFYGTDTFVYKLITYPNTIASMWTDEATVTITVTPVNDVPVAVDDAYSTDEDTELVVDAPGVLTNDSDIDGDALTAVLELDAANGTLALAADGSFTYLPDADFFGEDSFTYKAYDGELYSEVVTVTITVNVVAPDVFYIYLPLILK